MKILVTGGAGFIGSHIVDAYIKLGHEVVILDNLSSGKLHNINPCARLITGNVEDEDIYEIITQEKPDVINHHAAHINVRASVTHPVVDAKVNVIGGINVFKAGADAGVKKIILASSAGTVYGEQTVFPCNEDHPIEPLSQYGVSKITSEMYLRTLQLTHSIDYISLRYSNVYGPRQNPHGEAGVIAIFLNKILTNQQLVINGDGLQTRDYIYISDVVDANVRALTTDFTGAYNISSGKEVNVLEIYQSIMSHFSPSLPKTHGPAMIGEPRRGSYAYDKALEFLQWSPTITLPDGIKETIRWFQDSTLS